MNGRNLLLKQFLTILLIFRRVIQYSLLNTGDYDDVWDVHSLSDYSFQRLKKSAIEST